MLSPIPISICTEMDPPLSLSLFHECWVLTCQRGNMNCSKWSKCWLLEHMALENKVIYSSQLFLLFHFAFKKDIHTFQICITTYNSS
ncbi:hypothetical protein L1987_22020 [Smallanthus sonchifolius]|uniref:Uncharacterized protein n=1 Tax=Smallanthus sonchifolius TaxID=185202 RepID=A0ACB9IEN1_9ASTR|nr:hypothetical protein L1987_22020 [Smallanthus sonchifolius]